MALSTNVDSTVRYICIRVPLQHHPQPILSQLISRYGLTVNITAACVEGDTQDNAWFKLEIQGSSLNIKAGLAYLKSLNIDIEPLNNNSLIVKNKANLKLLCVKTNCCKGFPRNKLSKGCGVGILPAHDQGRTFVSTPQEKLYVFLFVSP